MKKRRILLALLALALAVSVSLPAAMAYFTTNARATGSLPLELGGGTNIEEVMAEWQKQITISANEDSMPMWVRARAYAPDGVGLRYFTGEGWTAGDDGWYYYTIPLANPVLDGTAGATSILTVAISPFKVEEAGTVPDGFEVPVLYESAPVLYNEDGERLACNDKEVWSQTITRPDKNN